MERYEVDADARLSELIERAERGDEVVIVRGGREVARVTVPDLPNTIEHDRALREQGLKRFAELRASLGLNIDAAELVREMRDAGF